MKKTSFLLVLSAILFAAIGCQNESATPDNPTFLQIPSTNKVSCGGYVPTLEFLDTLNYEEFSGIISPEGGAWVTGEMESWPKGCLFAINVPPNALPEGSGYVEFSMRIPTFGSYMNHSNIDLPLIIRLEPSNIDFLVPVSVMCTYMPWSNLPSDACLGYTNAPDADISGQVSHFSVGKNNRVLFEVPHFSDWVAGSIVEDGPTLLIAE